MTEDETVGWHHRFNGHEFEQTPGDGEGKGSLVSAVHVVAKNQSFHFLDIGLRELVGVNPKLEEKPLLYPKYAKSKAQIYCFYKWKHPQRQNFKTLIFEISTLENSSS